MFTMFGAVAMLLAAVGIYGVMSFAVNQRRQELGVRMALGADRRRILAMVLRKGSAQVLAGLVVGIGLAYSVAKLAGNAIQNVLFNTQATDLTIYAVVTGLIIAVSAIAVVVPARRATKVDPLIALRSE